MPTPRRRRHPATGAFLLSVVGVAVFLLAGCATFRRGGDSSASPPLLVAPPHAELGRILSYDADDATAVIEFVPQYRGAPFLTGTRLIARRLDTLEPTALLVAAPYQSGRILGAYVTSGRPRVNDEVVIAPEPPPAP
jgi:hypothetical protein